MALGLTGRRAIVLGTSRGLKLDTAIALAAEGTPVLLCGRNGARFADPVGRLKAASADATYRLVDLAGLSSVGESADDMCKEAVEIQVNNADSPPPGPIGAVTVAAWQRVFQSMVAAVFPITAAVLPGMRAWQWGRIVSVVSSGVAQPIRNLGMSKAVRASIICWAKALASEVAAEGIVANSVAQGRIHSERVDELDLAAATRRQTSAEEIAAASRTAIPVGCHGALREVADVVTFLASARANYATASPVTFCGSMAA